MLTASDLPPVLIGRRICDIPLLARDRVRFVGEKVAVVAADDVDTAEEALGLIEVQYEELPAVFDPFEAMLEGAPILHPDFQSYKNSPDVAQATPNLHSYVRWQSGDVGKGFAQTDLVFEDRFTVPIQHQAHLEPHGCLVQVDASRQTLVWSTGKQPFATRAWMAGLTGLAADQFTIMPAAIGGDFGGKGFLVDEPLAYFLAKVTGRPVAMLMTQAEDLSSAAPRHSAVVTVRTGLDHSGRIVARHARLVFNTGAYAGNKALPHLGLPGAARAAGLYRSPNTLIESLCVYTNQVPCGHMRAPGDPQAVFAIESHTDMLAQRLGMDPLEFRRLNVIDAEDVGPLGERWAHVRAREVLERAAAEAGWNTPKPGRCLGRGIAITSHGIGSGKSGAIMSVDGKGHAKLLTGVPDVGTGAYTIFRQIAAEVLTIPPSDISVEAGDTGSALFDTGSGADRVTHVAGQAVQGAAAKLKDELCALAPELLGWREGAVRLERGQFLGPSGGAALFRELAARAAGASGGTLEVRHAVEIEGEGDHQTFVAQVAEVSVDPETGQVEPRRMVSAQDVGYVLNPVLGDGQVQGGALIGVGYGLMEDLRVENGQVTTLSLGDYKIPCIRDVPDFRTIFLDSADGPGPFGGRSIGEVTTSPAAAAIANAVFDAVGVRLHDLPITAEKVHRALSARKATGSGVDPAGTEARQAPASSG